MKPSCAERDRRRRRKLLRRRRRLHPVVRRIPVPVPVTNKRELRRREKAGLPPFDLKMARVAKSRTLKRRPERELREEQAALSVALRDASVATESWDDMRARQRMQAQARGKVFRSRLAEVRQAHQARLDRIRGVGL